MRVLLLRLDAPLMSFGAPIVDNHGVIQELPGLSMLTGLIGNALGYDHRDSDALQRLQDRLKYAVCRERAGEKLRDFQTVDFSQGTDDFKVSKTVGWTTRGRVEKRAGGDATIREKHIRYRDYWADARYLLAVTLEAPDEAPTVDNVAKAIEEPERPLFLGRKVCLPASPLAVGVVDAASLLAALKAAGESSPAGQPMTVFWEEGDAPEWEGASTPFSVTDERDWRTQLHGGQRIMRRSSLRGNEEVTNE